LGEALKALSGVELVMLGTLGAGRALWAFLGPSWAFLAMIAASQVSKFKAANGEGSACEGGVILM
jgi:hypothetical protein